MCTWWLLMGRKLLRNPNRHVSKCLQEVQCSDGRGECSHLVAPRFYVSNKLIFIDVGPVLVFSLLVKVGLFLRIELSRDRSYPGPR